MPSTLLVSLQVDEHDWDKSQQSTAWLANVFFLDVSSAFSWRGALRPDDSTHYFPVQSFLEKALLILNPLIVPKGSTMAKISLSESTLQEA